MIFPLRYLAGSFAFLSLLSFPSHADPYDLPLNEFTELCEQELEIDEIPGFNCSNGILLNTTKFGTHCDAQPLLGFGSGCTEGSRMGRLPLSNPDVAGVWVCRKYNLHDNSSDDFYHDIAMIVHNKKNGKTCFFQNDLNAESDSGVVLSPKTTTFGPGQNQIWSSTGEGCTGCHTNDPFISTPHVADALADLGLARFYDPFGPYSAIGDGLNNNIRRPVLTCASGCHFGTSQDFHDDAVNESKAWMQYSLNGNTHFGPPPGSIYSTFVAGPIMQRDGQCIYPKGGSANPSNGTLAVLNLNCLGDDRTNFKFTHAGSIKINSNGSCLHPSGGADVPTPGTNIVFWNECDKDRLAFEVTLTGQIRHVNSKLCIQASSAALNAELKLQSCNTNNSLQKFISGTTENKTIVHSKGRCISTGGTLTPANGVQAVLSNRCVNPESSFALLPNGLLHHIPSGKCLRPDSNSSLPEDGTKMIFSQDCSIIDRNKFEATPHGSLRHVSSNKCIHPEGGSDNPSEGTPLVIWSGCDEERLKLTVKSKPVVSAATNAGKRIIHSAGKCITTPPNPDGSANLSPSNGTSAILSSTCHKPESAFSLLPSGMLQHVSSGMCLHPNGDPSTLTDGLALVFDHFCQAQQKFKFELTSKGSLKHIQSGKCIHPSGGSSNPDEGTPLVFWTGCDQERIKFDITTKTPGTKVFHRGGSLCITTPNSLESLVNGDIAKLSSSCSQSNSTFALLGNGMLSHPASGKCLHPSHTQQGTEVDLVFYDGCTPDDKYKFELTNKGSLKHIQSGKCIHPKGGQLNPAVNTNLVLYPLCDEDRLKFTFDNR